MPGDLRIADDHPLGIVALVRFRSTITRSSSPWFCGPYGYLVGELVSLPEPVACRGMQGWWPVEGDVLERVRDGYRRARGIP